MKIKLKYKKIIVFASMFVLGIGTLTLSLSNKSNSDKETVVDNEDVAEIDEKEPESQMASFINKGDETTEDEQADKLDEDSAEEEIKFNKDSDPAIVDLITQYLEAKLEPNDEVLTPLVNDISLIDIDVMERETSIIEKYDDVTTYIVESPNEGTSIVYVDYNIKFHGIETSAPAATRFVVVKEADKDLYIYNGEIEDDINTFINEFEETNTYKDFVDNVNTSLLTALEQDTALEEFTSKLNAGEETSNETESETSNETQEETTGETESETTTETEEAQ